LFFFQSNSLRDRSNRSDDHLLEAGDEAALYAVEGSMAQQQQQPIYVNPSLFTSPEMSMMTMPPTTVQPFGVSNGVDMASGNINNSNNNNNNNNNSNYVPNIEDVLDFTSTAKHFQIMNPQMDRLLTQFYGEGYLEHLLATIRDQQMQNFFHQQ
jgi:hypothetical protein